MDLATAEMWMREALIEARKAEEEGEVPIGAVLLINGKIIARGRNQSIGMHDPSAHAEILALRDGARNMRNYRLSGASLVVTLEPCLMCAGAMIHARIEELVYAVADPKAGAIDSHLHLSNVAHLNHEFAVTSGVLEQECGELLRAFFASRR